MAVILGGNTSIYLGAPPAPPAPVSDPDAQAFLTAAAITNPTIRTAVNQLVIDLKAYGIWTKMKAIYPFVGGTASTHKFNLKNPLDTDAAFRLTFFGGWIHSATGAKPNGTNAYAETYFLPSVELTTNYGSAHYYSRTTDSEITIGDNNGIVMGARANAANDTFALTIKTNPSNFTNFFFSATGTTTNQLARYIDPTGTGFYSGSLFATNSKIYRNGVNLTTSNFSYTRNSPNIMIYIGAINNKNTGPLDFTLKESALAAIGDSLTDTENANYNLAVTAFETTLGRNV
jgi:hypothetical protein